MFVGMVVVWTSVCSVHGVTIDMLRECMCGVAGTSIGSLHGSECDLDEGAAMFVGVVWNLEPFDSVHGSWVWAW